jgi:hypothetical protein
MSDQLANNSCYDFLKVVLNCGGGSCAGSTNPMPEGFVLRQKLHPKRAGDIWDARSDNGSMKHP